MKAKEKSYFHKLSQNEVDNLFKEKKTYGYILENFKQPDWCSYPDALRGKWGCWSLNDCKKDGLRTKISERFCGGCDCFAKIAEI